MANSTRKRKAKRQNQSQQQEIVIQNVRSNEKSREDILAEEEAGDLCTLREFAAHAVVVEFEKSGRVARNTAFLPCNTFDEIDGLFKATLPSSLLESFAEIHEKIKGEVGIHRMVPWAGVGQGMTRLRGFGFLDKDRRKRLNESGVRLYAREKESIGELDILEDEFANNEACTVLVDEWKDKTESAAQILVDILQPMIPTLVVEDLIALQPNLHSGATHLAAHVDFPRHEGFGKVICTIAVAGSGNIILIERDCNDGNGCPRAWRFRLNEGDCYVLSGSARNRVLHAVLADENTKGDRESLNLRFGLHTAEEAENEVMRYWKDAT